MNIEFFVIICAIAVGVGLLWGNILSKKIEKHNNNLCEYIIDGGCWNERKFIVVKNDYDISELSVDFYCEEHKNIFLVENSKREKYSDYAIRALDGNNNVYNNVYNKDD